MTFASHSVSDSASITLGYEPRSLHHERRMLKFYREAAPRDAGLLQPLANACWRAASFEWSVEADVETVERLWGEAARALAQGWGRRRSGFDPAPESFVTALHLAIAAREIEAFTQLAHAEIAPRTHTSPDACTLRGARALTNHALAYGALARAILTRDAAPLTSAHEYLEVAQTDNDLAWWESQYPEPFEALWRYRQHAAECALLNCIARHIDNEVHGETYSDVSLNETDSPAHVHTFAHTLETALLDLQEYVTGDHDHHPKFYLWLPGIALCRFAASSRLPLNWLDARRDAAPEIFAPLPPAMLPSTIG